MAQEQQPRSGQFNIYKKVGAAQFALIGPTRNDKGWVERDGCVFLEMAPGKPNGKDLAWDWTKKISFGIGIADIQGFFGNDNGYVKLTHDAGTDDAPMIKILELKPGEGQYEGTFMLSLSQTKGEEKLRCMVGIAPGEYQVLVRLLSAAIPKILGWS